MFARKFKNTISCKLHNIVDVIKGNPYSFNMQYLNIGKQVLPRDAKRALIIYNSPSIPFFLKGKLDSFYNINAHSMYWEAAEMVRILNIEGYIVDFIHFMSQPKIVWEKYDLIIDSWDFLKEAQIRAGTKTVFYATGAHWLIHNMAELKRICSFQERHNICLPADRLIPPIQSHEYAQYTTVFGNDWQIQQYNKYTNVYPLNISSVFIPKKQEKNIDIARKNFLWIGGGGMIHKGLDLVVEAFMKMPQLHLFIAGNPSIETEFWNWLKPILGKYPNIHLEGWQNVSSEYFGNLAAKCIGVIYTSAAEGGPGSVAQALHFGLIPIVTESSNVKGQELGYVITTDNPLEIINEIVNNVKKLSELTEAELVEKGENVRQYALKYHTRESYSKSFSEFIKYIDRF